MNPSVLNVGTDAELLSYVINSNPVLRGNVDLPVQGQDIKEIGRIILNNQRYRNAFINTMNLIGVTVIKRNGWKHPWDFTVRGQIRFGQQIREMILDIAKVFDYNKAINDTVRFTKTAIPNVFNYIHEVNYQKFYEATTSDAQVSMAFDSEGGLFEFIEASMETMYTAYEYDKYLIDKYMLCRRIVDGTMTSVEINNYENLTPRQKVSAIKRTSNDMIFMSPNFNPAGIRRATSFDKQILIVNTKFEADFATEVLATSFFKDEAEMRSRLVLIDGFKMNDEPRLMEILEEQYVPFTEEDQTALDKVPAVLISDEWFMDYYYAIDAESDAKETEFYNPVTLQNNHFLHVWMVFSTSPFENGAVFTPDTPTVESITVNPGEVSISDGNSVIYRADVETTGFANKAVKWSVTDNTNKSNNVTITQDGVLNIPADFNPGVLEESHLTVTATSIYDESVKGQATVTVL